MHPSPGHFMDVKLARNRLYVADKTLEGDIIISIALALPKILVL